MPSDRSAARGSAPTRSTPEPPGCGRTRSHRMTIDFSDSEIDVLRDAAKKERLTVADLVRASALLLDSEHRQLVVDAAIASRE